MRTNQQMLAEWDAIYASALWHAASNWTFLTYRQSLFLRLKKLGDSG